MLKGHAGGLAEVWRTPIAELFDASEIDEGDIVTERTDREAARTVWTAILDAAVAKIEAASKPKPSAIARAKALAACLQPTIVTDVTGEATSSGPPAGDDADAAPYEDFEITRTPRSHRSRAPSPEELQDMAEQGASEPG